MKGDFSRNPLNPFGLDPNDRRPDLRVLMQQGRVQLDADWNAQVAGLLHYLQALAEDLIGPFGGPSYYVNEEIPGTDGTTQTVVKEKYGFEISISGSPETLTIGRGRYYVHGILCENYPPGDADTIKYSEQENYPFDDSIDRMVPPCLVYLDVWERHLTCLEAPTIHEIALGEADTATRTQVIWQVKVWPKAGEEIDKIKLNNVQELAITGFKKDNLATWWPYVEDILKGGDHGRLKAWAVEPGAETSLYPCLTAPEARYRGQENRLYRVEIHCGNPASGGPNGVTFKWSRDNGAMAANWLGLDGNDLIVDQARDFAAPVWVELTDDTRELRGEPGVMVKVIKVEGQALTMDPTTPRGGVAWSKELKHPKVRRWDHREFTLSPNPTRPTPPAVWSDDGTLLVRENEPILLEDGITIQFEKNSAHYHSGDYWLIPARTASADVEWPKDGQGQAVFLKPHGIEHHYAPLAVIKDSQPPVVPLQFQVNASGKWHINSTPSGGG